MTPSQERALLRLVKANSRCLQALMNRQEGGYWAETVEAVDVAMSLADLEALEAQSEAPKDECSCPSMGRYSGCPIHGFAWQGAAGEGVARGADGPNGSTLNGEGRSESPPSAPAPLPPELVREVEAVGFELERAAVDRPSLAPEYMRWATQLRQSLARYAAK